MSEERVEDRLMAAAAQMVADDLKERGKITAEQSDGLVRELMGLTGLNLPPSETPIEDLLTTICIVSKALIARDKDKGFEAITVLLLQWLDTFNYSEEAFEAFQLLEGIKNAILAEDFNAALTLLLGILPKIVAMEQSQEIM